MFVEVTMHMTRKSFNEKLNNSGDLPKVEEITDIRMIFRYGGSRMLIAPALYYDEAMRKVPFGRLTTSDAIRAFLAREHDADFTCPLTAGIFINIAANASHERKTDVTPYWRTLKKNGMLNEKFPMGIDGHRELLENEGHAVIQKGKGYYVKDYEKSLFEY